MNSCTTESKLDKELIADADHLFKTLYPSDEPGAAVLIMKGDSVIFEKGYGIANMDSMSPIDENTFFNIASVSKQFSAVALMMLAERGALSLDDNVKRWFPEFESTLMEKISLRHLLSHTSGIPDSRDRSDRVFVTTATDTQSYKYIGKLRELNFEPGEMYEYMNPTYQLMYTIIERSSGVQFDQFMRDNIFDPAGMSESTYFEADKSIPRMAHGYLQNKESGIFDEFDYGEESFFATKADGGLYTSVREFVKWEMALRENILIDDVSKKEAHSTKIEIKDMPGHSYGYGWFIEKREGFPDKIYHTGNNGGFQIYAGRYPDQKILYLIFSNRDDRDREKTAMALDSLFKKANWF
ncbi:MAG: serine hydrolase domain-containing protein [Bacteroidales bacterium]|jgi:CubicO group peptidase (beta-lactamase class C family)|nr:serine hydrolase domain-containing protein [Bacteroidales bacterium]